MSWVSVHRSGIRLTTLRLRSLMRTSLTLSGHGSKGRTPVFSSCPGESASYAVHSRLESDPPDTPVEEVTLILSSLTQMGLFDGPRRDQERRIAETGRRLRDRLGGVNALYRVEEIAPWHPAPEMRALQVPVDPLGAGGRQAAPLAGARGGQGRGGARACLRAVQETLAARSAYRRPVDVRSVVAPEAGDALLLPRRPRRRRAGHRLTRRVEWTVGTVRAPDGTRLCGMVAVDVHTDR